MNLVKEEEHRNSQAHYRILLCQWILATICIVFPKVSNISSQNTNSGCSINVLASILVTESACNLDPFSSSFNGGISCIWGIQHEIAYRWAASLTISGGYGNTHHRFFGIFLRVYLIIGPRLKSSTLGNSPKATMYHFYSYC